MARPLADVGSGSLDEFADVIHGFNLHYPDTLEEHGLFPKHGKMQVLRSHVDTNAMRMPEFVALTA